MIFFLIPFFLVVYFFDVEVYSENGELNDDKYYQKGVTHYDNGEFKKSFIVFFNLSQKDHKAQFLIFQICILKV